MTQDIIVLEDENSWTSELLLYLDAKLDYLDAWYNSSGTFYTDPSRNEKSYNAVFIVLIVLFLQPKHYNAKRNRKIFSVMEKLYTFCRVPLIYARIELNIHKRFNCIVEAKI